MGNEASTQETIDADFKLLSNSKELKANGVLLMLLGDDTRETPFGKIVFSLADLQLDSQYVTSNGTIVQRVSIHQVVVAGKRKIQLKKSKLSEREKEREQLSHAQHFEDQEPLTLSIPRVNSVETPKRSSTYSNSRTVASLVPSRVAEVIDPTCTTVHTVTPTSPMRPIFCISCGATLPGGSYCIHCGAKITVTVSVPSKSIETTTATTLTPPLSPAAPSLEAAGSTAIAPTTVTQPADALSETATPPTTPTSSATTILTRTCDSCQLPLEGKSVNFGGKKAFHVDCFTCQKCQKQLIPSLSLHRSPRFVNIDDCPYCEDCGRTVFISPRSTRSVITTPTAAPTAAPTTAPTTTTSSPASTTATSSLTREKSNSYLARFAKTTVAQS